jgi:hypothetical protein
MTLKIAIIDSGVEISHPRLKNCIISGIGLIPNGSTPKFTKDFNDTMGHGTAISSIIHTKCPSAELIIVKIVSENYPTNEQLLIEGISWCLKHGINLINISLGTSTPYPHKDLHDICKLAYDRNIPIVAAANNNYYNESYPAYFPFTLGVTGGQCKQSTEFGYISNSSIEFVAKGETQRIATINGQYKITSGTSYAAAHFTGIIANLLLQKRSSSIAELKEVLIKKSCKDIIASQFISHSRDKNKVPFIQTSHSDELGKNLFINQNQLRGIKDIAIFPVSEKEMKSIFEFQNLCSVGIKKFIDYPRTFLDHNKEHVDDYSFKIEDINSFDTLAVGYYGDHQFDANIQYGNDLLDRCIRARKNIITWDSRVQERVFDHHSYTNDIKIILPEVNENTVKSISPFMHLEKIKVPVLAVIGTSNKQGKFTTQIRIKDILRKNGYEVGHLSTEPQGLLLGANFCFPYGHQSTVHITNDRWGYFLRGVLKGLNYFAKPHIIITGTQSKIIPRLGNSKELISTSLLDSIAFITAIEPDAVICAINPEDTIEIIDKTISVINSFTKAKLLAFVMTPWLRNIEKMANGQIQLKTRTLDHEEYYQKMEEIRNLKKVPVLNIKDSNIDSLLLKIIEGAF